MGFLVFQICFVDYGNQCSMSMSSASEPESSLMTLTGSDSISASSFRFTATEIPAKWRGEGEVGRLFEGGDYSREAIILNISVKGGDYSKEAINRGTAIIRGNTVFTFSFCPVYKFKDLHVFFGLLPSV